MKAEICKNPIYFTRLTDLNHIIEDARKRYLIQLDLEGEELLMPEWGYNKPSDILKEITERYHGTELLKTSIVVNIIKKIETPKLHGFANKALNYIIKRIQCDRIKTYKILDCQ